jgi:hypothetical protein
MSIGAIESKIHEGVEIFVFRHKSRKKITYTISFRRTGKTKEEIFKRLRGFFSVGDAFQAGKDLIEFYKNSSLVGSSYGHLIIIRFWPLSNSWRYVIFPESEQGKENRVEKDGFVSQEDATRAALGEVSKMSAQIYALLP